MTAPVPDDVPRAPGGPGTPGGAQHPDPAAAGAPDRGDEVPVDPATPDPGDEVQPGERPASAGPDTPRRRLPGGLAAALALTVLLALYIWQLAGRGITMIGTGEPVAVAIGAAALILPLIVIGLIVVEYRLAATVQAMADILAADGDLPVDDLPRSPGGRIDRAAADAAFEPRREAVEAAPDDWRAWYHLAFAYDAAGDRKRAREALRRAVPLFRASTR